MASEALQPGLHADDVRAQLDRIIKEGFRGPSMMTRFLEFTVERTLAGDAEALKEIVVGMVACERGNGFDPRVDSIVRVTANRVRAKLDWYYAGPGKDDPIGIDYLPGRYAPVFTLRQEGVPQQQPERVPSPVPAIPVAPPPAARRWVPSSRVLSIALAAAAAAVAVGGLRSWRGSGRETGELPQFRFRIETPSSYQYTRLAFGGPLAISPDGGAIAVLAKSSNQPKAELRIVSLADSSVQVHETGVASQPFWSPDGKHLGLFRNGRLSTLSREGKAGPDLCGSGNLMEAWGGSWSAAGVIVAALQTGQGLSRVPAAGGAPCQPITKLAPGDIVHAYPHFLPDGEHFLYSAIRKDSAASAIYAASLSAPDRPVLVIKAHSAALYSGNLVRGSGAVVYADNGSLRAIRFDAGSLRVSGEPWIVEKQVGYYPFSGAVDASVSHDGVLAFRAGAPVPNRQLISVDRYGRRDPAPLASGIYRYPSFSPDGKRVLAELIARPSSESDLWVLNGADQRRLTLEPGTETGPVWSPDGQRMIYGRDGQLWIKDVEGGAPAQLLTGLTGDYPTSWSRDGHRFAFSRRDSAAGRDVCIADISNLAKPTITCPAATQFGEYEGQFSPDGRWLIYRSNESGLFHTYAQRVDGKGEARLQVSSLDKAATGGKWRGDGREIFYMQAGGLHAVPVSEAPGGTLALGTARKLFDAPYYASAYGYAVSPDGNRFLFSAPKDGAEEPSPGPINVVLNRFGAWRAGLDEAR